MFTCDLCQLVILVKWIHNSSNFHASCKLHAQNIVSRLFEVVTEKLLSYTVHATEDDHEKLFLMHNR